MKILCLAIFALSALFCNLAFATETNVLARETEWLKQARVIDTFVWESAEPFYGRQLEEIRRYGRLKGEESKPYTSGLIDVFTESTHRTFRFSGVLVQGFFVPKDRFFVQSIEVTSPTFIFPKGLRIGSSLEDVKSVLGIPISLGTEMLQYGGESETVTFHFERGRVVKVHLQIYTG